MFKCNLHLGHPPPKYNNALSHLVFMGLRFFCVSATLWCLRYFTPFRVSSFVTPCVSSWHLIVFTPTQTVFFRFKSSTNISLGIKRLGLIQFTAGTFMLYLFLLTFNFNLLWCSERMCRLPGYKTTVSFLLLCCRGATPHGASHFQSHKPRTNLTQPVFLKLKFLVEFSSI